jgi:GNAT superfamily N-acetyltransferase
LIDRLDWDSRIFGIEIGRVRDARSVPGPADCRRFSHVSVKVPQQELGLAQAYEALGFRFITIDYVFERPAGVKGVARGGASVTRIARQPPQFAVSGFSMAGSRLALDAELARRMPRDFWDQMIVNHCSEFADFGLCAVEAQRLDGFVSCFERGDALDLFLVAVRPEAAGKGIGGSLIAAAVDVAAQTGKKLTTNVVSQNLSAMRFYVRHGFLPAAGDIVLHYANV